MIKYILILLTSVMFGTVNTEQPLWCIEDVIIHERE